MQGAVVRAQFFLVGGEVIIDRDPLKSKVLAVLLIALSFIPLYLARKGYSFFYRPSISLANEVYRSEQKTYIQIYGEGVYAFPMQDWIPLQEILKMSGNNIALPDSSGDTIIQSGSRITIGPDGSIDVGSMDGEKLLLFDLPIDINKADAKDLEALPGIGEVLAGRILEMRETLGDFSSVGELKKVRGIGEKKLREIAGLVETR
ncbi:MAG: ComEA family DNA-binding protein [Thermodesulfobacteriota bacterium]